MVTQGDLIGLACVYGYVAAIILLSHILRNKTKNPRKIVHLMTGGIVFFWWVFDTPWVMAGLAALPFIPILLLFTPISPIEKLKNSSMGSISTGGHPYGLVMYAISWTVIAFFLFDDLYAASIAIAAMSFGDGMGEVVGRRFGRIRFVANRTVEGSAAVFTATVISVVVISWFYFGLIGYPLDGSPISLPFFAAGMALMVTILEAVTPGKVDNLVIPLFVGGFLHVMGV